MGLFNSLKKQAAETVTCMYGDHLIPLGQPYIAVLYSRERFDGNAVTVDDCGTILWACLQHAPSEAVVTDALAREGIPA